MKVKATRFEINLIGNGWIVRGFGDFHMCGQPLYVKNLQDVADVLHRLATEPTEVEVDDDDD